MSAINYKEMTVAQLQQAQTEIAAALKTARSNEVSEARRRIESIAASVGISLKELLTPPPKAAKTPAKPVPVKYRNPDNSTQEWTGRGRMPRWATHLIANGRQLTDLQVRH